MDYKTWAELEAAFYDAKRNQGKMPNGEDYAYNSSVFVPGVGNVQGAFQTFGSAEQGNQEDRLMSLVSMDGNPNNPKLGLAYDRDPHGGVAQREFQKKNGLPMGLLLPFGAAGLGMLASGGMFGGAAAGAGGAAEGGIASVGAQAGAFAPNAIPAGGAGGMGLTGAGGIGSAGSLAGQGIAGWGAGAEGAAAAAGLGSLGDQGANEVAKLLRQNAAEPGSLLNTNLPFQPTTGGGFIEELGRRASNAINDPNKLAKLWQGIQGMGGGGRGAGGGGGGGGGSNYDPNFKPREAAPYKPMTMTRQYNEPTDPYWSRKPGGHQFFSAPQYSYAFGGQVGVGVDEAKMKALRKKYRSAKEVGEDIGRPGSPATTLGIRSADDPNVKAAFAYTSKQGPGKKQKNAGPFKKFGAQGFAQGGGIASLPQGDGMSDSIPATIDGQQPAELSTGEYVIPADAVSHLGNGDTGAGTQQLDQMIARIRQARTGKATQAPQINPADFLLK